MAGATRTVLAVVEMEVRDLQGQELIDAARDGNCSTRDIPALKDYTAMQVAKGLDATEYNEEAYAGSGVFLKVESVTVVLADYIEPRSLPEDA